MKRISIIFLIFFLATISCKKDVNEQKPEKQLAKVSQKEIYAFANFVINDNEIAKHCGNILDRKTFIIKNGDSLLLTQIDEIFDKKDLEFIKYQYLEGNKFVWNERLINKEVIIIDSATNHKNREEFTNKILSEKKCIGHMDLPLFNREKNMAILEVSYYCGILCAEGGIFIYKKDENNKWKLYKTLEKWIS